MQNTKCSAQKQHLLGCNNVLIPNKGLFHFMSQAGWKPHFLVENVMLPAFWHLELASKKLSEFQNSGREGTEEADCSIPAACDAAALPRKERLQFPHKQSMGNFSEVTKCLSALSKHALD